MKGFGNQKFKYFFDCTLYTEIKVSFLCLILTKHDYTDVHLH